MFESILREKGDRKLISRQNKKDEGFTPSVRFVVRKAVRTQFMGIPLLSDDEYREKYYGD